MLKRTLQDSLGGKKDPEEGCSCALAAMLAGTWEKFWENPVPPIKQGSCTECDLWKDIMQGTPWIRVQRFLNLGAQNGILSGINTFFLVTYFILFLGSLNVSWFKVAASRNATGFFRARSSLRIVAAYLAMLVGLGNLGLVTWEQTSGVPWGAPLHEWVLYLVQGLTWITLAGTLHLNPGWMMKIFLQIWWVIMFALGTSTGTVTVLELLSGEDMVFTRVLALLSWPVSFLLLLCAFTGSKMELTENELAVPLLNGHNSTYDSKDESHLKPLASSLLSQLAFLWLNPLLALGYVKPLKHSDLPDLSLEDRAETAHFAFSEAWRRRTVQFPTKKPSIFWVLASIYGRRIAWLAFFALVKSVTLSAGPLLLHLFVDFAGGGRSSMLKGLGIVLALFLAKTIESLSQRQWNFGSRRTGMHMRSALIGAVYEKELRLSNSGRQMQTTGEVVNYMVVDAYRIGDGPIWLHLTWTTPLQIVIGLVILFVTVQWASIAGLIVIVTAVMVNTPLARIEAKNLNCLMKAQDSRMRATSEALRSMKILKLQAWELKFQAQIEDLREVELYWLKQVQFQKSLKSLLFWMTPVFVSTATFLTCGLLGIALNASNVFTALATLRIIQEPIRQLPDVFAALIQVRVSLSRLTAFLQEDELQPDAIYPTTFKNITLSILIENGLLSWDPHAMNPTLKNINVKVEHGQRVAICGAVGSGKSSLLSAILGEIPKISGVVKVNGRIAYVAQTAWIQGGTVRDNILFGKEMNEARYNAALKVCALDKDIENFQYKDLTEIGERGINMSGGQKQRIQIARAVYQDADIYLLDDPFSAVDAHTGSRLFEDCIMGALSTKTVILVTHQVEFLPAADVILLLQDGKIVLKGSYDELNACGSAFEDLVTASQESMSSISDQSTITLSNKTDPGESKVSLMKKQSKKKQVQEVDFGNDESQLTAKEHQEIGNSGLAPYVDYLSLAHGAFWLTCAVLAVLTFIVGQVASNWWMAARVDDPGTSPFQLIGVYSSISILTGWCICLRTVSMMVMGMSASRTLFNKLLNSIFLSPMAFFDSTPAGRILSRFSSDMSTSDIDVPLAFGFIISSSLNTLSTMGMTVAVTWQTIFIVIPLIFINRWLQNYYLTSARELMRINGTTKSPIVNHFGETIAGVVTIRAYKVQEQFMAKNLALVNENSRPFLYSIGANEWLIQRLETLCAVLLCTCGLFLILLPAGSVDPGFAGLAISYGLSLNVAMVASVQNQCNLANNIISVERLKQYMYNTSEAPAIIETNRPPTDWPQNGKVQLENLKVQYRSNSPLVLKGITCTFEAGQRIGVVGRTGSGKTTLISSLFRLVEPTSGRIIIDNIDISTIGLHDLRMRLSIIPQEPTMFRGSIRFNMDPIAEHSDDDIWKALDKCQLGDLLREKAEGLDYEVTEDGENWSMGQRQLFCLGRVLLRHSHVLVLDEATASIDNTTDTILQKIIRDEFADCTVITVAHRIPTVIDSDMVLALSDGAVVEFDKPEKLLGCNTSLFASLVLEYWAHTQHTNA